MNPAEVIAYQWVVNERHPRLVGGVGDPARSFGGDAVVIGQTGPVFALQTAPGWDHCQHPPPNDRWGLDQIWHLRNGQKVIARKKPRF